MKSPLFLLLISILMFFAVACDNETQPEPDSESTPEEESSVKTLGHIEIADEAIDQILNTQAVPEIIGEGFTWSEGPVWVEEHNFLLFSDVPENRVYKWTEENGGGDIVMKLAEENGVEIYLEPSGYTDGPERGGESGSNGLIIDNEGALVLCQHGDRRIARMNAPLNQPEPEFITIAGQYNSERFNSPNDVVQHSSGSFYFTDPPYGLEGYVNDPAKEIDVQGVYRTDPDGAVTLLTDELSRPNGLAFSPDESLLYVANSDNSRAIWMVYDVMDDGGIENIRVFYDATDLVGEEVGMPDGMKVRSDGIIFATGPGGVWIFTAEAQVLGKIKTGEFISNIAFDAAEETIYMTADSYLLKLDL